MCELSERDMLVDDADTEFRFLSDAWADTGNLIADEWNNTGSHLHGCLQQLYLLKQQTGNLKVFLCIGEWAYSPHFALPASTPSGRSTFVASAVSLVKSLGLDGIDID
jgi:chitinase